jgi:putative FmdB family regulatory protein
MPIYEYRCTRCGHVLEVMQKLSDPAPTPCPSCQAADPLERLVSRTSFQLKGGGWYSDLYGSVKKDAKPDGAAPAAPDGAAKPAAPAAAAAPAGGTASSSAPASGSGGSSSAGGGGASSSSGSSSGNASSGGSSSGGSSSGGSTS